MTAAELLSAAAFGEGKHAHAFPSLGSERTGAPVMSFCRIADSSECPCGAIEMVPEQL